MDRRLRQLVLERARFCCEYCQMPQVFSDAGHEMDSNGSTGWGNRRMAGSVGQADFVMPKYSLEAVATIPLSNRSVF
jgi:hypothetical protein